MEQLPTHVIVTIVVCSSLGIIGLVAGGYGLYIAYFYTPTEDLGMEMVQMNAQMSSIDILEMINDLPLEDPQFLLLLVAIFLLLWDKS